MRTVVFNLFLYIVLAYVLSVIATYVLKQPLRDADKKNLLFDKLRWDQFYSLPSNKVDILFLGSSHAYRGFNPEIIDSMTHLNSFIVGSPAQTPVTSYYALKNVLLTQSPKTIVLENYFFPLFYETEQLYNGGAVYDNIKNSPVKQEFFKNGFNLYEKCALTFAPILRYKNNYIYILKKIIGQAKLSTDVRYINKGYVESEKKVTQKELKEITMFDDYEFDSSNIVGINIKYFEKTIELCKQFNMRIILFTCPVPIASYKKIKNPNDLYIYFKNLSDKYHIKYYNYLNPKSVGLNLDTAYFSDYHHLNKFGSEVISKKVSQIIN